MRVFRAVWYCIEITDIHGFMMLNVRSSCHVLLRDLRLRVGSVHILQVRRLILVVSRKKIILAWAPLEDQLDMNVG